MVGDIIGKGLKSAGGAALGAAVPGLGKVATGVNVAAGTGKAVASWAVFAGIQDLFESVKDPGFLLFVFGSIAYFFGHILFFFTGFQYTQGNSLRIVFSLLFLVYSVMFIFKGRGMLLTILFLVWYFVFGTSLHTGFFITAGLIVFAYALFFKMSGMRDELVGLLPILVFYLDIGLLSFIVVRFDITLTPLLINLILLMPWWGYLGLMFTKKDSALINILKFVGIAYIFIIIIMGAIPTVGFEKTVPGFGDLAEAREVIQQKIAPGQGIKLVYYRTSCTLKHPANPDLINECVKRKGAEDVCKPKKKESIEEYNKCVEELLSIEIKGVVVKELTATQIAFKRPKEIYQVNLKKNGTTFPIAYDFITESTNNPIRVIVSCKFIKGKKNFSGEITPVHLQDSEIFGKEKSRRISCVPSQVFSKGSYKVLFEATALGVTTISYLDKIFVGEEIWDSAEEKSKILNFLELQKKEGSKAGRGGICGILF